MSAQEDLTVALWGKRFSGDADETAAMVLDALKAAGYVVVKLPEPIDADTDNHGGSWATWHDVSLVLPAGRVLLGGGSYTPEHARSVAASLLAAADAAEVSGVAS